MYNTSNPTFREFRLIIVWKLLDDYVSEKEHPLLVKNYINPQYRDLILAIKEILPHTTRDQYTLYCRYKGSDLFQINDYISMITAFRIMEAHDSPLLYLIRKDIGEWPAPQKDTAQDPGDAEIIFRACPNERVFTDIHRGRTEHKVFPDEEEEKIKKDKKHHSQTSVRRQSSRGSTRRKSNRRQSNRRQSNRKQSNRRQSSKKK
ncbi:uncharacterized protein LOC106661120 [Cimex lectularius]|uniref:Uncharacterized protein n=1 Tax=Cimex lectularius TaxID=79782 RepID=A0A8I6R6W4_CIMLE|nr:uncharacterized protein LOC106661120 [Cimex lectularius]